MKIKIFYCGRLQKKKKETIIPTPLKKLDGFIKKIWIDLNICRIFILKFGYTIFNYRVQLKMKVMRYW